MIAINLDIKGDKVVIKELNNIALQIPDVAKSAINKIAAIIFKKAQENLSGSGAKASKIPAGGYPVPVRTGHLKQALNWLKAGQTKSHENIGSVTAGPLEAMIYNVAGYAEDIHEGEGSSTKHGRRPFLEDAVKDVDAGEIIEDALKNFIRGK